MRPLLLALTLFACAAPLAQPRPIAPGDVLRGTLDAGDAVLAGDGSYYDLYRYRGAPEAEVVFTLRSADFDAFLVGGQTEALALDLTDQDDDGAGGTDARLVARAGASGEYVVLVNTYEGGQSGAYTLSATAASGPAGAATLASGGTVRGELSGTDPTLPRGPHYDLHTFQGEPFEAIEVTLAAEFDAYLLGGATPEDALRGAETDDDGGDGTNARLRAQADASGRYAVLASSFASGTTGPYTLSVQSAVGGMEDIASFPPLALGASAYGVLDGADEVFDDGTPFEAFVYEAEPGEEVEITMSSSEFDPYLLLYRVFGGELEEVAVDDDSGPGLDARIRARLDARGTYAVYANAAVAGGEGAFTLTLARPGASGGRILVDGTGAGAAPVALELSGAPAAIRGGEPVQGRLEVTDPALSDGSYADTYLFRGTPGERVAITLRSDDFDAFLILGAQDGADGGATLVARDDDAGGRSDARISYTPEGDGALVIQANSYAPGATGAYTLLVERASGVPADARERFAGKWAPVTYEPTTAFADVREAVRTERRLERTAQGLGVAFPLPRNVPVSFQECGEPNAFYDPIEGSVGFCYELLAFLEDALRSQVAPDRLAEAVRGAYEFVMLHEAGHAMIDQLDLPITGREEDVADQFAALHLIRQGTKGARAAIDGVLALGQGSMFTQSDYAGEHSLGPQRFYNVACLVYGSNPLKYPEMVGPEALPEDRAGRCAGEYAQVEKAFDRLLGFVYSE